MSIKKVKAAGGNQTAFRTTLCKKYFKLISSAYQRTISRGKQQENRREKPPRSSIRTRSNAFRAGQSKFDVIAQKEQAVAAGRVYSIWVNTIVADTPEDHPYLLDSGIQPYGQRINGHDLAIPDRNEGEKIVNLQFISRKGGTSFYQNAKLDGCFNTIGNATEHVCIVVDFAIGAKIHEDTGQQVVIAFTSKNLIPVSINVKDLVSPETKIGIVSYSLDPTIRNWRKWQRKELAEI